MLPSSRETRRIVKVKNKKPSQWSQETLFCGGKLPTEKEEKNTFLTTKRETTKVDSDNLHLTSHDIVPFVSSFLSLTCRHLCDLFRLFVSGGFRGSMRDRVRASNSRTNSCACR